MHAMRKKTTHKRAGRRGLSVSLHPLTPDQALQAVLALKAEDVKKVIAKSKPKSSGK